jgi:hypothetical protein
VQSQQSAVGTVTLTTPAPAGGIVVNVSTADHDVAQPPPTVTVPAGSNTANFTINTSTVAASEDVQISAQYLAVGINTILRVTIIPPIARFTVTGALKGDSTCLVLDESANLDCRADASTSSGFPKFYIWTYNIASSTDTDTTTDPHADVFLRDGCPFLAGRSTSTDGNGDKYLNMDIGLVIQDREDTMSAKTTHTVKLYVNGHCDY